MVRTIKLGLLVAAIVAATAGSTQAGFQTQTFDWTLQVGVFGGQPVPDIWTGYLVLPFKGDGTGSPLDVEVLTSPDFPGANINGTLMNWNDGVGGSFTVKDGSLISGGFGATQYNGGLSFTGIDLGFRQSDFFLEDFSQPPNQQELFLTGSTLFSQATPEPGSFTVFGTVFLAAGGWGLLKRRRFKTQT